MDRYNRPVLPGKSVASFSDLSMLRTLVNLLSFFTDTKADWFWLGNRLALRGSVKAEGTQRFHSSKKKIKKIVLMVFSSVCSCVYFYFTHLCPLECTA